MKRILFLLILFAWFSSSDIFSQQSTTIPIPKINVDVGTADNPKDVAVTLQILLLMTILSLAPSIIIMTTSYLRIIIAFHFLRNALGTMQMPPNQVLAGLALFLTVFIMNPTINKINDTALQPYLDGKITLDSASTNAINPMREFMLKHTREEDLAMFISFNEMPKPQSRQDIPVFILIPSFVISELRAGFIIGFFLFIPFLMIDMIVSSILMSMGMMMIPPMMVALPFKILLFVLVDGWNLIVASLLRSFV